MARNRRNRNFIISDDNIEVEIQENIPILDNINESEEGKSINLTSLDVIKMLGGYQVAGHNIVPLIENTGECLLCGKTTNSVDRNICWDCHEKHMSKIYNKMKYAELKDQHNIIYEW